MIVENKVTLVLTQGKRKEGKKEKVRDSEN